MIEVYSWATPNGHKIHIMLEECGLAYRAIPVDIGAGDQFTPEFLAISPNNKIPAIVDPDGPDGKPISLFESGAILVYLAAKTGRFLPADLRGRYATLEWLMFQMGGIGPMMGQANVFGRYWHEVYQPAIDRYRNESRRLFEVLNGQLADHEYLAGDYSIADIANWCWVRTYPWSGVSMDGLDHLQRWIDKIQERPAVQRGVKVPVDMAALRKGDGEGAKQVVESAKTIVQR
jgi:GST-like protein